MALKLTEFFHRRPGMSAEAFLTHWQQQHTGVVSAIEGLRRYVQNPAAGLLAGTPNPYDGMVEVWFDGFEAIERVQKSAYWETIVEDELRFVDRPSLQLFFSEEPLPAPASAGFKLVYLLHRRSGQSEGAFREALQTAGAPDLDATGFLSLQRILPCDAAQAGTPPCADALEIWRFQHLAALEACFKSDPFAAACRARAVWADAGDPLTTEERVIR